MIIRGVFTDHKLSVDEIDCRDNDAFIIDHQYLKNGDMVTLEGYDQPFQIRWIFNKSSRESEFVHATVLTINDKLVVNNLKSNKKMELNKKNGMFSGILSRYTAQFMPQQETDVRMSMGGTLCVKPSRDSDDWIAIDSNGDLTSYPEAMTIELPFIFSIAKPTNQIHSGEIIKNANSYSYVIGIGDDGTLKTLSYSGYTHNKKAIKDAVMGQATTKVIVNPFNFDEGCGFNPIMLALANGDSFDVESLMALSMTPQGKNLFSNTGGGFNMALLWMLDKNKQSGNGGSMMEMLMMSQMMQGGNNPFTNMFGPASNKPVAETQETKQVESSELDKVNAKVDKLADALANLVNVLTPKVEPKEENK
mgnify:CR=1 FL=1